MGKLRHEEVKADISKHKPYFQRYQDAADPGGAQEESRALGAPQKGDRKHPSQGPKSAARGDTGAKMLCSGTLRVH